MIKLMNTIVLQRKKLRQRVMSTLTKQGYKVKGDQIILKEDSRQSKRNAHLLAKAERILTQEAFILKHEPFILKHLPNGKDIEIDKIAPRLIQIKAGTKWEILFKWWSLVWWSLPNERAYGRQMRFLIWDQYHKAPIGLIGLQSPILSWSVRDQYLGIQSENRDYWVNQSLSAQRLGALPPYNQLRGGKLVASLLTSNSVRNAFEKKYKNVRTIMEGRKIPARLLFVTTTGAYGMSGVYTRLKFKEKEIASFIGFSSGIGSFHIPNLLYQNLIKYLESKDINVDRGYGAGPSRKLRIIDQAMELLGFKKGTMHSIGRGVYLFPLASNLKDVIAKNKRPRWIRRTVSELTEHWRTKWAIPQSLRDESYKDFIAEDFVRNAKIELQGFKHTYRAILDPKTKKKNDI